MNGKETSQFLSDASWAAVAVCGVLGVASVVATAFVATIIRA